MTRTSNQFTLYHHTGGPNPWKVQMVLEELGLTYESKFLDFKSNEHKQPLYTKLNPNGRVPTLIDHSRDDFVIWESGAIILYLAQLYDKGHKLSFSQSAEDDNDIDLESQARQWLFFQVSGQGPYFGQSMWFNNHPEKVQSAITRYESEVMRVLSVLDGHLEEREWLVGDKCTYADISFAMWDITLDRVSAKDRSWREEFPHFKEWHERVCARPAVKKCLDQWKDLNPSYK